MNVLFVCLNNLCRSPIAEGILRKMYLEQGIKGKVDSAGFESFHINDAPDPCAIRITSNHGIDISQKKARLFRADDFDTFDHIFVMDIKNMQDVQEVARNEADMKKVDFLYNCIYPGKNISVPNPCSKDEKILDEIFEKLKKSCEVIASKALKINHN